MSDTYKYCPQCGTQSSDGWRFCAQCGLAIEKAVASQVDKKSKPPPISESGRAADNYKKLKIKQSATSKLSPEDFEAEAKRILVVFALLYLLNDEGENLRAEILRSLGDFPDDDEFYNEHSDIVEAMCIDDQDEFEGMCAYASEIGVGPDVAGIYYLYRRAKYLVGRQPGFWGRMLKDPDITDNMDFKGIVNTFEEDPKTFSAFKKRIRPLQAAYPLWSE